MLLVSRNSVGFLGQNSIPLLASLFFRSEFAVGATDSLGS